MLPPRSSRPGKLGFPADTILLQLTESSRQLQFQDFLTQKLHLNYHYFNYQNTSPPWICTRQFQTYFSSGKHKKKMFAWNFFFLDHPLILKKNQPMVCSLNSLMQFTEKFSKIYFSTSLRKHIYIKKKKKQQILIFTNFYYRNFFFH